LSCYVNATTNDRLTQQTGEVIPLTLEMQVFSMTKHQRLHKRC
jgi:hypothetical protein